MKPALFILLFFFFASKNDFIAQEASAAAAADSLKNAKEAKRKIYSSPRKAAILSAIVPGLGQVYNKKYYKVAIIYGLGALAGYVFLDFNSNYYVYKNAIIYAVANDGYATVDGRNYSTAQLSSEKSYYKKYRDMAAVGLGLIYVLNIIDANVGAHLKTFDVSDDLSLNLKPWQSLSLTNYKPSYAAGLTLTFNLK